MHLIHFKVSAQKKTKGSNQDSSFFHCHCEYAKKYDFSGKVRYTDTTLENHPVLKIRFIQRDGLFREFRPLGFRTERDDEFTYYFSKQSHSLVAYFSKYLQEGHYEKLYLSDFRRKELDSTYIFHKERNLEIFIRKRKGQLINVNFNPKSYTSHFPYLFTIEFSPLQGVVLYQYHDGDYNFDCKIEEPLFPEQKYMNYIDHFNSWQNKE